MTFVESHILTACLHNVLVLKRSGTHFNVSGFFITVSILTFKDLYMSIISTTLYVLNKKKKKKKKKKLFLIK